MGDLSATTWDDHSAMSIGKMERSSDDHVNEKGKPSMMPSIH
jgi:hypothetical protein